MNRLQGGIWPVMLTPFTEAGEIDFHILEELTEFYIAAGANGLFANCLSSEMYHLSEEERLAVTKSVVQYANGRVPVISTGTFSENNDVNAAFIKRLIERGVSAAVVNSNQLCGESEDENVFKKKLESLMNLTRELPLGIYECPVPYKRLLSEDLLSWMSDSGRFLYFKDTSCDADVIKKKLAAIKGSSLYLYNANTATALQSLNDGAAGLSTIGANYYPELYTRLYSSSLLAPSEELKKIIDFLNMHDETVHAFYPYSAKCFLGKRGLGISTYTRTDYKSPTKDEMKQMENLFHAFEQIAGELGISIDIN